MESLEDALFDATLHGDTETARKIDKIVNLNIINPRFNSTPLFLASLLGHTAIMRLFLSHDDININRGRSHYEIPPLTAAASVGKYEAKKHQH